MSAHCTIVQTTQNGVCIKKAVDTVRSTKPTEPTTEPTTKPTTAGQKMTDSTAPTEGR